jgi:hypothetical protein
MHAAAWRLEDQAPKKFKDDAVSTTLVSTAHPRSNQLLASLPDAEWARWQPLLEAVSLARGQVLCNSGTSPLHVYFPTTATVSLRQATREGSSVEIAVIGHEGMVGISLGWARSARCSCATRRP